MDTLVASDLQDTRPSPQEKDLGSFWKLPERREGQNRQCAPLLPVLRLADYLNTDVGLSDEEGGKEAKRQKSEPTTPISTSSRLVWDPQTSTMRLW